MTSVPGLAPRFAAWRILHDVRHGVPFDVALGRAIADLEPDDRRLAHEIAAGVFRNRSQLDLTLGRIVDRGVASVPADALDVLRIGAFQLLHLDRVPAHAVVQTTVDVARRLGGARPAGFVNAILRRLAKSGRATEEGGPTNLAERYSHPGWIVDRWVKRFGPAETEQLLRWNNTERRLVVQPVGWSLARLEAALSEQHLKFEQAPFDAGIIVDARKPGGIPGFAEGSVIVQDPAQRLVTRFFAPDPGGIVYDACAAPGGKAVAISEVARLVIAADRRGARVRSLVDTIARIGSNRIIPIQADAAHPPVRSVDAVLLDVPCLGTGAFARNPDARWRVTPEALASLAAQAARFLLAAADVVRPGGLLLFATCSLEPEENEAQIERFLTEDRRFRREPSSALAPELLTPAGDLGLLPQRHGTDGAYAARLRKIAG